MQDIYIDKVKLHNVRSHTDMEMDFPVDNFTLIVGKNGSGKSTIPKSISMALYGDDGAIKGDRLAIADMVNCKAKKDLEIILFFRIVDGDTTDKYEVQLYQEHKKFRNKMFLFKNGIDISGKGKTETYEILENLLYPRDVYHNIVYFSQQVKDFFTSLTNSEQKLIFDSILSTQDYRIYYNNTNGVIDRLLDKIRNADHELSKIITSMSIIRQTITMLQQSKDKAIKDNQTTLLDFIDKKIIKENEIQITQDQRVFLKSDPNKISELNTAITSLKFSQKQLQNTLQETLAKIDQDQEYKLRAGTFDLRTVANEKINELANKLNSDKNSLTALLNNIYVEISKLEKLYDTQHLFEDHSKFNAEKQKEINIVNEEISLLDKVFVTDTLEAEKKERTRIIESNIQDLKDKASKLKEQAATINSQIVEKENTIREDEEKLNQTVPICSKCLRPFAGPDGGSVIRGSIDKLKTEVANLNLLIVELKAKMGKLRLDYDEAIKLKAKSESDYDIKINEVLSKKKDKSDILIRKRNLIQSEIQHHKETIDVKVLELQTKKEKETAGFKNQQKDLETQINILQAKLNVDKESIERKYLIDVNNYETEHIKMYDELRTKATVSSNTKESSLVVEISKLQAELDTLELHKQESQTIDGTIQSLKIELKSIEDRILECKNFSYDDSQLKKSVFEVIAFEKKLSEVDAEKKRISREKLILEFWKESFSDTGIKSMLIDMAIPHMNESVARALDTVAPGVFTVSFDTLKMNKAGDVRDKFNVNVLHNIKGTDSHKKLSGGEKRIVDLCCMEALKSLAERLYGKRFHNVFYDEVLDSLDDDSCQAFGQASRILSSGKNITLIAHKVAENVEPDRVFNF